MIVAAQLINVDLWLGPFMKGRSVKHARLRDAERAAWLNALKKQYGERVIDDWARVYLKREG